jgi:opacity protein-like surface antigen
MLKAKLCPPSLFWRSNSRYTVGLNGAQTVRFFKKGAVNKKTLSISKRQLGFVLILMAIGIAPHTHAQYSGYYVEGFYGSGNAEFNFFTDLSDFDGDANFYGITVGRVFNDNVAAEVSYVDFGDSESVINDPVIATLDAQLEAQAISVTLVGNYPFSRYWTAFGKIGFNQWDLEASVTDNTSAPPITLSGEDRGSGFNYGVGLQYRITPSYAIKLEYRIYQLNPELFEDDVVIGGATVALRFNY